MKKLFKITAIVFAFVMTAFSGVFGTVAYLKSTAWVQNTFTIGEVNIELMEHEVNLMGDFVDSQGNVISKGADGTYNLSNCKWVEKNKYKLVPGNQYNKDPHLKIDKDSEPCWVFIKIENGIYDIEKKSGYDNVFTQITNVKSRDNTTQLWTPFKDYTDTDTTRIYYKQFDEDYIKALNGSKVKIFESFFIEPHISTLTLEEHNQKTIKISAYAIQSENVGTMEQAYKLLGITPEQPTQ